MLIATADLARHRGEVAMVDGGFDPIHHGHVEYFERAAALGAPVLCNVAPDDWVSRKHRPLLSQDQRARVIDAFRAIAYTHIAKGTTLDVLAALRPKLYVKGADWRDRLPVDQVELCASEGIEIVFLETVLDSSTALLEAFSEPSD